MKKVTVLLSLAVLIGGVSVHAQTSTNLYWDANGATAGVGGTGNWTTNGTTWTTNASGTGPFFSGEWRNWTNGATVGINNAILQGTPGTVSLSATTIYANQIQVNTTGFTIQNSSASTTSNNRYFRTKNGIVLANGVNLNISSGITTNGAITGFEGPIVGVNGTNSVSTNSSITISGTTLNADSSVRIGLDTSTTDIWVPVIINTTGSGFASLQISSSSVTSSLYGNVTVMSGSRLVLGGTSTSTTRRINVRGNLSTADTDLTIGETGGGGMVVLYGNNSIGGNVVLRAGQLGYATNTAFGNSTVAIFDGTSFGQQGAIGSTDLDRTISNNISVQGNVTLGLGSYGNYFSGGWNLNGASRTFTIANSSYYSGSVTNGSLVVNNPSSSRVLSLGGSNNLTSLIFTQGVLSFDPARQTLGTFTMNGPMPTFTTTFSTNTKTAVITTNITTNTFYPTLLIQNPTTNSSISTGGSLVISGTNNTISFTNNNLAAGTYTLLLGTNLDISSLSNNGLTLSVIVPTVGTNTTNYLVAFNGGPVTKQRYTYTFSNTPTSLVALLETASPDINWGVNVGDWNTNPDNQPWVLDGSPIAFQTGGNVGIGSGGTLNVDTNGVTAGLVTISGASNAVIQGGTLVASSVTKNGAGTCTLGSATTINSGGLTVNEGVMTLSSPLTYTISTNATVINAGTLQTSGNELIPDGSIVQLITSGATFRVIGNETVRGLESSTNSTVDLPAGTSLTIGTSQSSVTSTNYFGTTGSGSLTKAGTNLVSFRGNNVLDTLNIASGRADLRGSNAINAINVATGAALGYGTTNSALGNALVNLSQGSSIGQIASMGTTDADRTIANNLRFLGDINSGVATYGCYYSGNVDLTGGSRALTLLFSSYFFGSMTNGDLVADISNTSTNAKFLYLMGANQFSNGVTLRPTFTGFPLVLALGNSNALGNGRLTLAGNASLANSLAMTLTNAIDIASNTLTVTNSTNLTLSGPIGGSGGQLIKANSGILTLDGAKTYTGTTTVAGGTLVNVISNLTATITPSTLSVIFSNNPVPNGSYTILPGALVGSYVPTSASLSPIQKITLNGGNSTQPASVTVADKISQTITGLAPVDTKTYGDAAYMMSVTKGSSSSPLIFSSDNNSVAYVSSEGLVTIVGSGSTTLRVNQAGDGDYQAAPEVTQVLTVAKANPTINPAPTASAITTGQALSSSTLTGGRGSVAGSFAWTDGAFVPNATGSYGVTFTPTDTANYNTATTTVSVTVNPADPLADYMGSFGLTGANAAGTADPDGDGQDNNAELAFGTDPTNSSSRGVTLASGTGTIKLVYLQRNSGLSYTVKSFNDLTTAFDAGGTVVTPTPTSPQPSGIRSGYTQYEASLSTGSGKGFLRVKAVR